MEVRDERHTGFADRIKCPSVVKKLKGIKNIRLIAAIFIIAIALLIYSTVATENALGAGDGEVSSSVADPDESRLASVLRELEGVGRVETMITRDDEERVIGVIVIAEGAEDIAVRLRLLSAVTTAMGVDKNIVNVYAMK